MRSRVGAEGSTAPGVLAAPALRGPGSVAGIDVGGSSIKAVAILPSGEAALHLREQTRAAGLVDQLCALAERLGARAAAGGAPLCALGLAVPGIVDEAAGIAAYSANLGWRDLAIVHLLEERIGLPVRLGHDVRLGALAEGILGAARDVTDYLFVPVGTGIAAALVLGGEPRRGAAGAAGEIGHLIVEADGPPCGCGQRGCLEAVASAAAIARLYRARAGDGQADTADVCARAQRGDARAEEVWRGAVAALARALAGAHALVDLELIVLGGGLANAGALLVDQLAEAMQPVLGRLAPPRLRLAALGDEAASLGAALYARGIRRVGPSAGGTLRHNGERDSPACAAPT